MKPCLLGIVLALGVWGTAGSAHAAAGDDPARPNVLLILNEDQGNQLSFLGTPGVQTPHMDAIARRGLYFNRAFVTYPVCSPSKSAIYTGAYPHATGLIENTQNFFAPADQLTDAQRRDGIYKRVRIADRFPTLTEIFQQQGYFTAVSGKLHVAPNEKFPYDRWIKPNTKQTAMTIARGAKRADKPFFFFCNIQAPHRPFRNSEKVKINVDPADVEPPPYLPDTPVVRRDWAEYLDWCEEADRRIGTVIAGLKQAGELENTIVIMMSDHGPGYHRAKMSLYQFGLHVPMAIAGPGIAGDRRTDAMVSEVDLLPTLMDLLHLPSPKTVQGRSFAGVVRGEDGAKGRDYVFAEIMNSGQTRDDGMQERSVFDGRFKLIYRENLDQPRTVNSDLKYWVLRLPDGRAIPWHNRVYDEIVKRQDEFPEAFKLLTEIDPQTYGITLPRFELYDTQDDPWELNNLADDPDQKAVMDRLRQRMDQWVTRTGDRYVTPAKIQPSN